MSPRFKTDTENAMPLANNDVNSVIEEDWSDVIEYDEWAQKYFHDTQDFPDNPPSEDKRKWWQEAWGATGPAIDAFLKYNAISQVLNTVYSIPLVGSMVSTATKLNMVYSGYNAIKEGFNSSGSEYVSELFTDKEKLLSFVRAIWEQQSAMTLTMSGVNLIPWILSTEFSISVKNALKEHLGSAANWLFTMEGSEENNLQYQYMTAGISIAALLYYQLNFSAPEPVTTWGQHLQKILSRIMGGILVTHKLTQSVINQANSPRDTTKENTREQLKEEAKDLANFKITGTDSERSQITKLNAKIERRGQHLSINHLIAFYQNNLVEGECLILPDPHQQTGFSISGDSYRQHRLANLIQIKMKNSANSQTRSGRGFLGLGVAADETDTAVIESESEKGNSLWKWLGGLSALSLIVFITTTLIKKNRKSTTKKEETNSEHDVESQLIGNVSEASNENSERLLNLVEVVSGATGIATFTGMLYSYEDEKQNELTDRNLLLEFMHEAKSLTSEIIDEEQLSNPDISYLQWEELYIQDQQDIHAVSALNAASDNSFETDVNNENKNIDNNIEESQSHTINKRAADEIENTDNDNDEINIQLTDTLRKLITAKNSPKGILGMNLKNIIDEAINEIIHSDGNTAMEISPDTKLEFDFATGNPYNILNNNRPPSMTTIRDIITGKFIRDNNNGFILWPESIPTSLRALIQNRDNFEKKLKEKIEKIYSNNDFLPQERSLFIGDVMFLLQNHNIDSGFPEEKINEIFNNLNNNSNTILKLVTINDKTIPQLIFIPGTSDEKSHVGIYISLLDKTLIEIKNEKDLESNEGFLNFIMKNFSLRDQTSEGIRRNILPTDKDVPDAPWFSNTGRYHFGQSHYVHTTKEKSHIKYKPSMDIFKDLRDSSLKRTLDDINYIIFSNQEQAEKIYSSSLSNFATLAAIGSAFLFGPVIATIIGLLSIAVSYNAEKHIIDHNDQLADDAKKKDIERLIFTSLLDAFSEAATSGTFKINKFIKETKSIFNKKTNSKFSIQLRKIDEEIDSTIFIASEYCKRIIPSRVKRAPGQSGEFCPELTEFIPIEHIKHLFEGQLNGRYKDLLQKDTSGRMKKSMKQIIAEDGASFIEANSKLNPDKKYNIDIGHFYTPEKNEIIAHVSSVLGNKVGQKTLYDKSLSKFDITKNLTQQAKDSVRYIKKLFSLMGKNKDVDFLKDVNILLERFKKAPKDEAGFYTFKNDPNLSFKIDSDANVFFRENEKITEISYREVDYNPRILVKADIPFEKDDIVSYENMIVFDGKMILDGKFNGVNTVWENGRKKTPSKTLIITSFPTGIQTRKKPDPVPSTSK